MRIVSLQLSNILSFPYVEDVNSAVEVAFDSSLNLIIGGNGSGKSTILEAINFVFKRVLFKPYEFNESTYNSTVATVRVDSLHVNPEMQRYVGYFRLNPNWQSETQVQTIKVVLCLDNIDKENFDTIIKNYGKISTLAGQLSRTTLPKFADISGDERLELIITLDNSNDTFSISNAGVRQDILTYLSEYELLRELILIYNSTAQPQEVITPLADTFTMLSAFRNYNSFSSGTSLNQDPRTLLRAIRRGNQNRGINTHDGGEPSIFSAVKLHLASHQYELMHGSQTQEQSTTAANELAMLKNINSKLEIINLKCSIKLVNPRNWTYSFDFYDTKHNRALGDINNLSAGQKSLVHLVFEAYGRDDTKGGLVVIDEPEIHLHYQFQYEYLRIIQDTISEQDVQYIIVTHSDGFIGHDTAQYIKRFSLNAARTTVVHSPTMSSDKKKMVEILDNRQSARALFANKIVLVEGPDDRYFFRTLLNTLHPELRQEISIYDTGGKDSMASWAEFFEDFGLTVYKIKDLDGAFLDLYDDKAQYSLKEEKERTRFKTDHPTLTTDIEGKYPERLYILKEGSIEVYMDLRSKGLEYVIEFCKNISQFINNSDKSKEVLKIVEMISS